MINISSFSNFVSECVYFVLFVDNTENYQDFLKTFCHLAQEMAQSSQPLPLDGARGLNGRIFGDKGNGPDVNKEADVTKPPTDRGPTLTGREQRLGSRVGDEMKDV